MEPLIIKAVLNNSFMVTDQWSPGIDSIIAYYHLLKKKGSEMFHLEASDIRNLETPKNLPFKKITYGEYWWWDCSSPIYDKKTEIIKYLHRRFDVMKSEKYMAKQKGRIQTKSGSLKNFRGGYRQIVTDNIIWHANGDRETIIDLLSRCNNIGAKTGAGHGEVKEWIVTIEDNINTLNRPLPVEYAKFKGIYRDRVINFGYRPAFRLSENKTLCVMP